MWLHVCRKMYSVLLNLKMHWVNARGPRRQASFVLIIFSFPTTIIPMSLLGTIGFFFEAVCESHWFFLRRFASPRECLLESVLYVQQCDFL